MSATVGSELFDSAEKSTDWVKQAFNWLTQDSEQGVIRVKDLHRIVHTQNDENLLTIEEATSKKLQKIINEVDEQRAGSLDYQ